MSPWALPPAYQGTVGMLVFLSVGPREEKSAASLVGAETNSRTCPEAGKAKAALGASVWASSTEAERGATMTSREGLVRRGTRTAIRVRQDPDG